MSDGEDGLDDLEARLGWRFSDRGLLERALTHASLSGERADARDLERLEFLGDRVLGLLAAEALWRRFPEMSEGDLAPRLNALVRKETCAEAARAFELGPHLRLAKSEADAGGRDRDTILGDVCEALLGALYIDGGLDAAAVVFDLFWRPNLDALAGRWRDAKTVLQEWAQGSKRGAPAYEVVETRGLAHAPHFVVDVSVPGKKPARGEGGSKRAAQTAAAEALLRREGLWTED